MDDDQTNVNPTPDNGSEQTGAPEVDQSPLPEETSTPEVPAEEGAGDVLGEQPAGDSNEGSSEESGASEPAEGGEASGEETEGPAGV